VPLIHAALLYDSEWVGKLSGWRGREGREFLKRMELCIQGWERVFPDMFQRWAEAIGRSTDERVRRARETVGKDVVEMLRSADPRQQRGSVLMLPFPGFEEAQAAGWAPYQPSRVQEECVGALSRAESTVMEACIGVALGITGELVRGPGLMTPDATHIRPTCDECQEAAATYSCSHEQCKAVSSPPGGPFHLCTTCADDHKKKKLTKSHNLVALGASSSSSMSTDTPQTAKRARTSEGGSNNAQGRALGAPLPSSTNTPETALRPRTGEGGSARQGGSAARQLPFNAASENNNSNHLRLCPQPHQEESSSSSSDENLALDDDLDWDDEFAASDTESDSDIEMQDSPDPNAIPSVHEQHFLLDKEISIDDLAKQLYEELPPDFKKFCKHDILDQIKKMITKYKSIYENKKWYSEGVIDIKDIENEMPEMIAGGMTQNNKTMIKAVGIWVAWRLGAENSKLQKIATVVVSTTLNGTSSLHGKLDNKFSLFECLDCLFPSNSRPRIVLAASASVNNLEHKKNMVQCILDGGCIVANDTAACIGKVISVVREARGMVEGCRPQVQIFMDEADAFYRNADHPIKLEQSVKDLLSVKPILRMSVSVSLIMCIPFWYCSYFYVHSLSTEFYF
jgi:hypothetical protein